MTAGASPDPPPRPKVSVCTRTFNHEAYVEQAIESVLAQQTGFDYELVISDDCSTDGTRAILARYRDRHPGTIRLLLRDRNIGGRRNFVETHQACRGEYVAMLDGDDYWTSPHKLRRQAEALEANEDWSMCFHPTRVVYEDGSAAPGRVPAGPVGSVLTLERLLVKNVISTNTVMYRNGLLDPHWPWLAEVPRPGDWLMYMLLAQHGPLGFLDEEMAVYRVHGSGGWSRLDYRRRAADGIRALRKAKEILEPRHRWRASRTMLRYWALGRAAGAARLVGRGR